MLSIWIPAHFIFGLYIGAAEPYKILNLVATSAIDFQYNVYRENANNHQDQFIFVTEKRNSKKMQSVQLSELRRMRYPPPAQSAHVFLLFFSQHYIR